MVNIFEPVGFEEVHKTLRDLNTTISRLDVCSAWLFQMASRMYLLDLREC